MQNTIGRIWLTLWVCLIGFSTLYGNNAQFVNGVLDLREKPENELQSLGFIGEWEFYWNELYTPHDFNTTTLTPKYYIPIPSKWNNFIVDGKKLPGQGYATYKATIIKDSSWNDLAIKIGSIGTAIKLYIDGELVHSAGKVGRNKNEAKSGYNPGVITFESTNDTIILIAQVSNFNYSKGGMWNNYTKFGSRVAIVKEWDNEIQMSLLFIGAVLIIAIYHLGLFVLNSTFRYTMYFSLFCLIIVSRIVAINEIYILELWPNFSWLALIKIEYTTLIVGTVVFSLFIYKFFEEYYSIKFLKFLLIISTIQLLIVLSCNPLFFTKILFIFQINILLASAYIIWVVLKALRNNNKYALILLAGFVVLLITIVNDILYSQSIIYTTYLTPIGFILFVISQAFMVSARYSSLFLRAESLSQRLEITNQNLEELVERRTSKIKDQNDLLIEKSDEIQDKNNALESQNDEIKSQRDYLQQQNKIVMRQKRQITSSIEYASRIQGAVIDTASEITAVAPDNFILFHPKDIVSGDFYWFKELNIDGKTYKIATVVDCTGHGVPGAFMSILGALFLSKVTSEFKTQKPKASEMLNLMRNEVKYLLQQSSREKIVNDGMDMALIILDYDSMELQFAGAHNPMYIIRNVNGNPDCAIEEYKGDPMPIGTYILEKESFTNYTIDIYKGDLVYLFSDGYYDQFGGEDGKKLKKSNFKRILINSANLPLNQQKIQLEKHLTKWRGDYDQIDDITIVGIKI